jgi:hypothetical protein
VIQLDLRPASQAAPQRPMFLFEPLEQLIGVKPPAVIRQR